MCAQCFLKLCSKRVPKSGISLDVSGRGYHSRHTQTRHTHSAFDATALIIVSPLMLSIIPHLLVYKIFSLVKKNRKCLNI